MVVPLWINGRPASFKSLSKQSRGTASTTSLTFGQEDENHPNAYGISGNRVYRNRWQRDSRIHL
jgi:hypothetical protein